MLKRLVELLKISPVVTIGGSIIFGAFIYTQTTVVITLDLHKTILAISLVFFITVLFSLKQFSMVGALLFYSKSRYTNASLRRLFFIKKAFANNAVTLLFVICVCTKRIIFDFSFPISYTILLFFIALLLSFTVMLIRNRSSAGITRIRLPLNPLIKSMFYDYENAVAMALITSLVSLYVGITLLKDPAMIQQMEVPLVISMLLFTVLCIGITGLFDAMPRINWRFYSIVSLDFMSHFKRSLVFMIAVHGIVFLHYIGITAYIDPRVCVIYTLSSILVLLLSVSMAFCTGNILKKILLYVIFLRLFLYALYIHPYSMLVTSLLVILFFFKARREYRDWTYV